MDNPNITGAGDAMNMNDSQLQWRGWRRWYPWYRNRRVFFIVRPNTFCDQIERDIQSTNAALAALQNKLNAMNSGFNTSINYLLGTSSYYSAYYNSILNFIASNPTEEQVQMRISEVQMQLDRLHNDFRNSGCVVYSPSVNYYSRFYYPFSTQRYFAL